MTLSSLLPDRTRVTTGGVAIGDEDQAQLSPIKLSRVPSNRRMYDLPREEIIIFYPAVGAIVAAPVTVAGAASLDMESLYITVLDAGGAEIGIGPAVISMIAGGLAYFSAEVVFRAPANTQPGRIQVWSESRRDGAIQHLCSRTVRVQGLELDALLSLMERALVTKDYAGLREALGDEFRVLRGEAADSTLSSPLEVEQFLQQCLEPADPVLDFSVSPQGFLTHLTQVEDLKLIHAVYSSGWGAGGERNAWLLLGNVGDRARWVGIYFLPHP